MEGRLSKEQKQAIVDFSYAGDLDIWQLSTEKDLEHTIRCVLTDKIEVPVYSLLCDHIYKIKIESLERRQGESRSSWDDVLSYYWLCKFRIYGTPCELIYYSRKNVGDIEGIY